MAPHDGPPSPADSTAAATAEHFLPPAPAAAAPKPPFRRVWYAPNGFQAYGDAEIDAVVASLKAGWIAGTGPASQEFEHRTAALFGHDHGLLVNSGSSANLLALAALDLPKGAGVVTPACTFATTVAPIVQLGLTPQFCDVDPATIVPTLDMILSRVTADTRAIMLPNLNGFLPPFPALRAALLSVNRSDIFLIEDSADTLGHPPQGADASTTSFYASHVCTAMGSGGMATFARAEHRARAAMLRDWGRAGDDREDFDSRFGGEGIDGIPYDQKFLYLEPGYNMRSSEANAAFGLVQLARLPANLGRRRANFSRYMQRLAPLAARGLIALPPADPGANLLAMYLRVPGPGVRVRLLAHLESRGVQTRVCFSGNVTRHPAFRRYLEPFEGADAVMREGFLVGCHHGMGEEEVDWVCGAIEGFFKEEDGAKEG
ncbi:pyridoxal phosphate-dependent transferase [Hyaloraphidium curvatum]|nr:pyridoxal phosphate-dependent transferase [Hyaloraphidium curvatum]